MSFRAHLSFASLVLVAICAAQVPNNDDPVITYSTPAVRASTAIDNLSQISHKRIRIAAPLDQEPLILRLNVVRLSDAMDSIATALDAKWIDEDGGKVLRRTDYATLSLKNVLARERANAIQDAVDARVAKLSREPLTTELAKKTILILNDPHASPSDRDKAIANSADERLIVRAMATLESTNIASAPNPDHAVYSTAQRPFQGRLKMGALKLKQVFQEQNTWTAALKSLTKQHPELRAAASARGQIEAKSRIILVFSDTQNGLPTHVSVRVIGPDEVTSVAAESSFKSDDPTMHRSGINWATQAMGKPTIGPLSEEFAQTIRGDKTTNISSDLRNALLQPSLTDPFQFIVSDALQSIGVHAGWNVVACPPDAVLLDPTIALVSDGSKFDAPKFMSVLEDTCAVSLSNKLLLVKPRDSLGAEADRTNRIALQTYLQSLTRTGMSLTSSEAAMATSNPTFDPRLLKYYASLLTPNATPFLDVPMSALVLYGALTPEQRTWLNKGMKYNLSDLTEQQRSMLPNVMRTSSRHIVLNPNSENVLTDPDSPEITDILGANTSSDAKIYMSTRNEKVLRVYGVDRWGRLQDLVLSIQEAPKVIERLGPWDSFRYAAASASTIRLTVHASTAFDVVNFLREYSGFSQLGPFEDLPNDMQSKLRHNTN